MNESLKEGVKEAWRWIWSYVLSNLVVYVVGLLISALPFFPVHIFPETVMMFGFAIPVRFGISNFVLPAIIRGLDKYRYQQQKLERQEGAKGIVGFNLLNNI